MHRPLVLPSLLLTLALALPCNAVPPAASDEARARELINSQGCKGCHRIDGTGGNLGPDLKGVGKRLSPRQIRSWLLAPGQAGKGGFMPTYDHLQEVDLDALVDYLSRQH